MGSALGTGNVWLSRPDGIAVGTVGWNILLPDRYFQLNYSFISTPKGFLNRGCRNFSGRMDRFHCVLLSVGSALLRLG